MESNKKNEKTPFAGYPWIAAAIAGFIGIQLGQVTGLWGAQLSGIPGDEYTTAYVAALVKGQQSGKPAAIIAGIAALFITSILRQKGYGFKATIFGAGAGIIAAAVAGFLIGYF